MTSSRGRAKYYRVLFDYEAYAPSVAACAPRGVDHSEVVDGRRCQLSSPVRFQQDEGPPLDYQENDLGWKLCSEKMKGIIESLKSPTDELEWFDALVASPDTEDTPYFILHFPRPLPLEILDREKTIFNPTHPRVVVRPWLKVEAIRGHTVFTYEGGFAPWFVAKEIRDALLAARCSGMELSAPFQS